MNLLAKITTGLLIILLLHGNNAWAGSASEYHKAMDIWSEILATRVDQQGRIDFETIATDPANLNTLVNVIGRYGPDSHPDDFTSLEQKLAYHINTYNALAMQGVIDRGIPKGFTNVFSRTSFFRLRKVTIAGRQTNLHSYENKVIRPLGEDRLHFALNCMVRDCPRLPQKPFTADKLEEQLEAASWEFFNKERHLRLDRDKKRIYVSAILDFYTKDFVPSGRAQDLAGYINQYRDQPLPENYQIHFIDYDWRINSQ